MGGSVSVAVHVSAGEGSCEFVRSAEGEAKGAVPGDGLRVKFTVGHLKPKECETGQRVTGIGEDSMLCSVDIEGKQQQMIRGRVRDKYFLFTLIAAKTTATDKASLRRMLEQVAEDVAGNLF